MARGKTWLKEHWRDPLYRNSYLLMLNTMVLTGGGFVFWLLAARFTTPDAIGVATAAVSSIGLLSLVARLGFDSSFIRHLPAMEESDAHKMINSAFTLAGGLALVGGVIFVLGTPFWSQSLDVLRHDPLYFAAFLILTMIWTQGSLMDSLFIARRNSIYVLYKNVVHSVLKIGALLLLVSWGAAGIVFGWTASMLLAMAVAMVFWLGKSERGFVPRVSMHGRAMRAILATSLANYIFSILLALPPAIGSLIILHRFGAASAGYFYVLWMFGSVALAAPTMQGQSAFVELAHSGGRHLLNLTKATSISIICAAVVFGFGTAILPLFGQFYIESGFIPILPYALAAIPGSFLFLSLAEMRAMGQHMAMISTAGALVGIFLVGLAVLPLHLGVEAAGWLWLATMTVSGSIGWLLRGTRRGNLLA